MKNKIYTLMAVIAMVCSCDFLNVVPDGTPTKDDLFSSALQAERFLYSIYGYIPNLATYRYMPDFCGGGEIITSANGQTRYFPYKSMLYGEENANNTYYGLWEATSSSPAGRTNYDLYKGIKYAYMMIDNLDSVPNISQDERDSMKGECWFLIGYMHWLLMEHYGPCVIVTKDISINAGEDETMLPRSSWDECAQFVSETLDKAAGLLPATRSRNMLGRATSVAAKALKARCLIYTASPLVNGNSAYANFRNFDGSEMISQKYDAEKWKTAMEAAGDAINLAESNGYKLYEDAESSTLPDASRGRYNYYYAFLQTWNESEYLFAFGDQTGMQHIQRTGCADRFWNQEEGDSYSTNGFRCSMGPTQLLVETYQTANGLPIYIDPETKDEYNANRLLTVDNDGICRLFKNRDPRFYATVGYDRMPDYIANGKNDIELRMKKGEKNGYTGNITHEYNFTNGYALQKFISISTSYSTSSNTLTYYKTAFPLIRLAELYLDYAEADFEYDGELSSTGLAFLNKVRNRAGLPDFEVSWAKVGGTPKGEEMRRALHIENMSELACEARQYHNIRRWNIAKEMLGETPDCLNIEGSTNDEYYTIVPMKESGIRVFDYPKTNWMAIPLSEIEINNRLVQNPGY